jgi:hypothetical protein
MEVIKKDSSALQINKKSNDKYEKYKWIIKKETLELKRKNKYKQNLEVQNVWWLFKLCWRCFRLFICK